MMVPLHFQVLLEVDARLEVIGDCFLALLILYTQVPLRSDLFAGSKPAVLPQVL